MIPKTRLHLDQPLAPGQPLALDRDQANYLFAVMRLQVGDKILTFNGRDGEWIAEVAEASKRGGILIAREQTRPQQMPPDLWLLFAPIKKARTDFIVEKAVEMGVARVVPVQTERTNAERVRQEKMQAHAMEAAEQCGATFVPEVTEVQNLGKLLANWPAERRILWCDEGMAGQASTLAALPKGPWAILIGPEGGFSPAEQERLRARAGVHGVSLGPRILRADTAAVAALTLWQVALGDWSASG